MNAREVSILPTAIGGHPGVVPSVADSVVAASDGPAAGDAGGYLAGKENAEEGAGRSRESGSIAARPPEAIQYRARLRTFALPPLQVFRAPSAFRDAKAPDPD